MYIDERRNTALVMVTDYRMKVDLELGGVLNIPPLREYKDATRIALFEYKEKPDKDARAEAKSKLKEYLTDVHTRCAVVLPTVAYDEDDRAETICWSAFGAPEGLGPMRCAFYEWRENMYVTPLFGFSPFLKELQRWQNAESLKRARGISEGKSPLIAKIRNIFPHAWDVSYFRTLGDPIAVDIESIEGTNLITAVGLSNGRTSISIPVHEYMPYGRDEKEEAGDPDLLQALKELLADESITKIFHNYTFDVPRLESAGFAVKGEIHDTFCAMAIAYPELAHGLQTSCAILMAIPPWKSLWHPKIPGKTRDDIEFWICDPLGLRDYNAADAFYTWHLASVVLPQVGVSFDIPFGDGESPSAVSMRDVMSSQSFTSSDTTSVGACISAESSEAK